MKVSFKALEHYGFVVAMLAFAFMAYSDYSKDGDLIFADVSIRPESQGFDLGPDPY